MKFSLRAILLVVAISACSIVGYRWFRSNTIIRSDANLRIRMPNGEQLQTNQWFELSHDYEIGLLQTMKEGEFHLIVNTDSSAVATIPVDGRVHEAIITDFRIQGPNYRGEYWLRVGKEVSAGLAK